MLEEDKGEDIVRADADVVRPEASVEAAEPLRFGQLARTLDGAAVKRALALRVERLAVEAVTHDVERLVADDAAEAANDTKNTSGDDVDVNNFTELQLPLSQVLPLEPTSGNAPAARYGPR